MAEDKYAANWRGARKYQFDEETRRKRAALAARELPTADLPEYEPETEPAPTYSPVVFQEIPIVADRPQRWIIAKVGLCIAAFSAAYFLPERFEVPVAWQLLVTRFAEHALMELNEIIALLRENFVTAVLAAIVLLFLAALALAVSGVKLRRLWRRPISATELRFCNVFSMMGEDRRQVLIESYAKKYRCGREAAMQHALEQRDRDARSWR